MKRLYNHTFTGVDGEGWTDKSGKHHYITFTVGNETLYTGEPLTMLEVFEFLTSRPVEKNLYYVSYFFDYDVTMILRQLAQDSPEEAKTLFERQSFLWYYHYGIRYIPKKRFMVKRWSDDDSTKAVIVHDVQGFFQCSFVDALEKYAIGTKREREKVAGMKALRGEFTPAMAKKIISYSELECKLLAKLVEGLRDRGEQVAINPSPYEGPGPMAARALASYYGKDEFEDDKARIPQAVISMSAKAYYGGRFEITAHGPVKGPVYQYDINSAYPAAMLELPCLTHGDWKKGVKSGLYLAEIDWRYQGRKHTGAAMPFPVRTEQGSIVFPESGSGWYWSHEIELARKAGHHIKIKTAYSYMKNCDCMPFAWVSHLYRERQKMEAERKGTGIILKLVLNTLYGKMVQSRPALGRWNNMLYGSLITSLTRAKIFEVYLETPVLMFATDAVFTLEKIPRRFIFDGLGGFDFAARYNELTLFQPGIYFSHGEAKFKTRGVPKKTFREYAKALEDIALNWNISKCKICWRKKANVDPDCSGCLAIELTNHLSLRLGLHLGNEHLEDIGNWIRSPRYVCANPELKRIPRKHSVKGICYTAPYKGPMQTVPWTESVRLAQDELKLFDDLFLDGVYEGDL